MTDFNNTDHTIEDRLADYGAVLQSHLDGTAQSDDRPTGMFLVGGAAAPTTPKRATVRPAAAIISIAAAVLLLVGVVVPGLSGDDSNESITIAGGEVANQPQDFDSPADAASDGAGTSDESADDKADENKPEDSDKTKDDAEEDIDWSRFTVRTGEDKPDSVELAEGSDKPTDDSSTEDDGDLLSQAAGGADDKADDTADEEKADDDKADDDKADEDKADEDKPEDGEKADDGKADEDKTEDGEKADDGKAGNDCPNEGVVFDGECYLVVPPSCGDLEPAPNGDGCLKLVGSPSSQSGCPSNYERQGDTCVKLLAADVTCSEGTPANGSCLIKQEATGGSVGCAAGQLEIGGSCYELSAPTGSGCGEMQSLPNGLCRYPVSGEDGTSCPAGLEPWDNICYRYEAPPTYTCAVGESDGSGWCQSSEAGTPGPDVCDDGVLQDEAGCYLLVEPDENGSCGSYPEFQGKCRKDKPSYPTWTCADGKTVYENACKVWTEAVASCAAGEPVDGGTKCKTIADPITTTGCPSYALEDAAGCYKEKPASIDCGELHVAPDGQNCKVYVGSADGAGGECPAGFDLVGSYCKKYVDGTPSCSGAELVELAGKAKCRYTTPAGPNADGCGAGEIEKSGKCYLVVAPSCNELAVDIFGNGCKKPVKDA